MKYINLFYITILLIAASLYFLQKTHKTNIISFYGYAENKETEINFNYPVQVKTIHVSEGQHVKKDTPILDVIRENNKNAFIDQQFKIDGLNAERKLWQSKIEGQIKVLKEQKEIELSEIKVRRDKLLNEEEFGKKLYDDLKSISRPESNNDKIKNQLQSLDEEHKKVNQLYETKISSKEEEIRVGNAPYNSEINRLNSERIHKANQELIEISLVAPKDGLIGNVYCKEEEHFSSYKTLISFYEPNPSMIKGFIQEDFIMQINLEDNIIVRSTKDQALQYNGKVIGLGSRIVEIPSRLRKREDIKTYGREIIVSIPSDNKFLQKEKTILELVQPMSQQDNSNKISLSSKK